MVFSFKGPVSCLNLLHTFLLFKLAENALSKPKKKKK